MALENMKMFILIAALFLFGALCQDNAPAFNAASQIRFTCIPQCHPTHICVLGVCI
ncbi:Late nodulin [Caenorhabditis elegans]|uniref:Late nodulin n=1 Tax=Caenorhabditis elegans TaxID=6239 RepID=G3MU60_CAEEL|nr:Late nodulin [Caenorhabditis elegans]CCD31047.1 Late nodulin [Caenorhabditis elegans]|eukprot:NP_001256826.1 Uncharacterized protein CELE_C54E10.10 [Caenorhabditis elegans]